jgi:hypothetical protein
MVLYGVSNLSLGWLVPDVLMSEKIFREWSLGVVFDEDRFNKGLKIFRPLLRLLQPRGRIPWDKEAKQKKDILIEQGDLYN